MMEAIRETNFDLPNQVDEVYRGKVGDVYTVEHQDSELLVVVRTDRISAYDVVLPEPVPYKGQVLNQISAELLKDTAAVAPNWLLASPDPNVSIGYKAEPFKLEMIVRGYLLGSSWKAYSEYGARDICGNELPDDMDEFDSFETPIVTPTTKATVGHDEAITPAEVIEQGLATEAEYDEMERLALNLFREGQLRAERRGLVMADAKYELGRLAASGLVVIDEVHTPDAARYFPARELRQFSWGLSEMRPTQLSKEFVREWLAEQGFTGQTCQTPPELPTAFIDSVTHRYVDLYESILDKPFEPAISDDPLGRIETNINNYLEEISGKSVASLRVV